MIYPVKKVIKASLIALTLFFSLFTNSIAAEYEVPYPGFLARIQAHSKLGGFLKVSRPYNYTEEATGYNQSCGIVALLFAHSYQTYVKSGKPDALSISVKDVKAAVERQYNSLNLPNNSITSFPYHLKNLARDNLGLDSVYNYTSIDNMPKDIANGRIFVVNLRNDTPLNKLGMDHFITILKSTTIIDKKGKTINFTYFDPWYGEIREATIQDIKKSLGAQASIRINLGSKWRIIILRGKIYLFFLTKYLWKNI